jgi:glycosyltransferase involved in cell wall biosynthesis
MFNQPIVSFIIPYFNAGETIQETIDSIFNQTYQKFDVWIVNDGSTDPLSIEKLKDFEGNERIHILHQENAGPSVARNLAIEKSNADYFVPLDADDLIEQKALQRAIGLIIQDYQIGAVYGNFEWFGDIQGTKKQARFQLEKQFLMNQIAITALIRKEMWRQLGGYDTFLSKPGLEDWEFWLIAGLSNWNLQHCEMTFFKVRVNQMSRTFEVANKNLDLIKKYVFEKHALALAQAYETLWYQKKQLVETPDYRVGNFLMSPYRILKKIFF